MTFLAFAGYTIYDSFFRYSAYGVIAGRTIAVPAPHAGFVRFVHVQESERVRQGQLLMTLYDPEHEKLLNRAEDQLRLAQAKFQAGVSKLKWSLSQSNQDSSALQAEIYERTGLIEQERTKLIELQQSLSRTQTLYAQKFATSQELERSRLDEQGQREKLTQLLAALSIRKAKVQGMTAERTGRDDELLPLLAEIDGLEAERNRIRSDLDRLQVRAPANGIILHRHRFTGEGADFLDPLFTILEEDSEHVELYVPQDRVHEFSVGSAMNVQLAPFWDQLPCVVSRLGQEHVSPPPQIGRHYNHDVKTIPIQLIPKNRCLRHEHVQIGAVVKLPNTFPVVRSRGSSIAKLAPRGNRETTRAMIAVGPIETDKE